MINRDLITEKDALTDDLDLIKSYIIDIRQKLGRGYYYGFDAYRRYVGITDRQFTVSENCISYLHRGMYSDAWREFYDCIYNYNDCDHEMTVNEHAVYNILLLLFEYSLSI